MSGGETHEKVKLGILPVVKERADVGVPRPDDPAIFAPVPQVQFRSRVSPHGLTLEPVRRAVPPPRDIVQRRSRFVRDSSQVVEDVHLDRDRAEDLVLLPAVGEDPLLDDVLDDQFGLRASVRVSGRGPTWRCRQYERGVNSRRWACRPDRVPSLFERSHKRPCQLRLARRQSFGCLATR